MDNEQISDMEKTASPTQKETTSETGSDTAPEATSVLQDNTSGMKPGAILAAKRQEAGITEGQIAARLKMTLKQLHYLETDNYDALHGIAISRGFVRAYARVLNLNPDPLVAKFSDGKTSPSSASPYAAQYRSSGSYVQSSLPFRKKRNFSGIVIALLVLIVIALVVAWNMKLFSIDGGFFKRESGEGPVPRAAASARSAVRAAGVTVPQTPAPVSPSMPAQTQPLPPSGSNTVAVPAVTPPAPMPAVAGQGSASTMSGLPKTETTASVAASTVAKAALLDLNFREKSWIQVKKEDGSVMAEYIGKPGEKRQLEVNGPVMVTVGYAPGVNMTFRGAPVDLSAISVNSVARVNLK